MKAGEHGTTRAILWCLADLDPGMPLVEALGYLRAVEASLAVAEAEAEQAELERQAVELSASGKSSQAVADAIRAMPSDSYAKAQAQAGHTGLLREYLEQERGLTRVEAHLAAKSLVGLFQALPDASTPSGPRLSPF